MYKFYNGKLFVLNTDVSDLYSSFGDNFILMLDPLQWYAITSAFLLWKCTNNKTRLLQGVILLVIILFEAIASTAKGPLLYLLILYLFMKSVFNEKINYYLAVLSIAAVIVLAISSYYIRYYGVVRGEFTINTLVDNVKLISNISENNDSIKFGIESISNRLNYLDALAITMNKRNSIDTDIYWFGSLSELLNIFPRAIWENRPLLNFNIFTTRNIWGYSDLVSETPIGRIGESYLVLGFLGLIYAVFYGYLFAFIETKLISGLGAIRIPYYLFILYFYIIPDSHIVFYWKTILFISLTLYLLKTVYKHRTLFILTDRTVIK
jgi:hypothetical protein